MNLWDDEDVNKILNACFFVYCSLLGVFFTENTMRNKWLSIEQASNETVAKKILAVPFGKSRQF